MPELARYLPHPLDRDEAGAAHYQLFGFNVFPHESLFMDESGLLGGAVAEAAARDYRALAIPLESADGPDHVGQELAALAYLCREESAAARDGRRLLLERHLLRWLSPFVLAVKAQRDAFYTAAAETALALAHDHYRLLAQDDTNEVEAWTLPEPGDVLSGDKTGLKDIAHYLTTPAYSGIYLGRDDIGRLARDLNVPRGFGSRRQLLTNLLRSAAQYDQFERVVAALDALVAEWQAGYAAQADDLPLIKPFLRPWSERAAATADLLAAMREEIGAL